MRHIAILLPALMLAACGTSEAPLRPLTQEQSAALRPADARLAELYDVLNRCNDMVWNGAFTWWAEQKLMVWRYGLVLSGGQVAGPEQIDRLIAAAVMASERLYPAFQLVSWGDQSPAEAMKVAIAEAYGRA